MAESEQKLMNKAITDGHQPVHNEAGDLVPGGVPPADVASAPVLMRDSRGKFAAGGTIKMHQETFAVAFAGAVRRAQRQGGGDAHARWGPRARDLRGGRGPGADEAGLHDAGGVSHLADADPT